jgi:hypothetical protein
MNEHKRPGAPVACGKRHIEREKMAMSDIKSLSLEQLSTVTGGDYSGAGSTSTPLPGDGQVMGSYQGVATPPRVSGPQYPISYGHSFFAGNTTGHYNGAH